MIYTHKVENYNPEHKVTHTHTHTHTQVSYTASIEERSRGGTLIQFEESGEMTSPFARAVVSPLTPSTNYRFRVAAVTERGQGEEIIRNRRTESAPSGGG